MDKKFNFINQDVASSSEEEEPYNCAGYSGRIEEHFDSTEIFIPDKVDESSDSSFEIVLNEFRCPNHPGALMDNPRERVAGAARDVQNEELVEKELAEAMVDIPKSTETKEKATAQGKQHTSESSDKMKISSDIEKQLNVTIEKLKESSVNRLNNASEMPYKCNTKPSGKTESVVQILKKSVSKLNISESTSGAGECGIKEPVEKLGGVQNKKENQSKLNESKSSSRAGECGINKPSEQFKSVAQTMNEIQSKLNKMGSTSRAGECDLMKPSGELESVVQTLKEVQSILKKAGTVSTRAEESTSRNGKTVENESVHQLCGNPTCRKSVSDFRQTYIHGDLLMTSDKGTAVTDETVQPDIPCSDNAKTEKETSERPKNSDQITLEDLATAKEKETGESIIESVTANETSNFNAIYDDKDSSDSGGEPLDMDEYLERL